MSLTKRLQSALADAVSIGPKPLLELIERPAKGKVSFDFESAVNGLSKATEKNEVCDRLQIVLEKVLSDSSPESQDSDSSASSKDEGTKYATMSTIAELAKALLLHEGWIAPVSLFSVVCMLHGEILGASEHSSLQSELSGLCEMWFMQDRSSRESVVPQMITYLLAKALANDSKQVDVNRLYTVRKALKYVDWEDDSSAQLRILVQRTFLHVLFLTAATDGKKFLVWVLTTLPLIGLLHKTIKTGLIGASKWKREAYAYIYFRSWQISEGASKLRLETLALSNLVDSALHVQNAGAKKASQSILQYFVDQKASDKNVEDLLFRLYQPLLFRALQVANPSIRENALHQLGVVFPLVPPVLPQGEFDKALQEQFDMLVNALEDSVPAVRSQAVLSIGRILSIFWDILPSQSLRAIISHFTEETAFDKTSAVVRESVFRVMIAIIQQAPSSHHLFAEKQYLNKLAPLIFDTSERVRLACASLLESVKKLKIIKFYDIVPFQMVLEALGTDSSPKIVKALSRVLHASYWPYPRYPVSEMVDRAVEFISSNPKAAVAFYSTAKLGDPKIAAEFVIGLWSGVMTPTLSVATQTDLSDGAIAERAKNAPIVRRPMKRGAPRLSQKKSSRAKKAESKQANRERAEALKKADLKDKDVETDDESTVSGIEDSEDDEERVENFAEGKTSSKRAKLAEAPLVANQENIIACVRIVSNICGRIESSLTDKEVAKKLQETLAKDTVLMALQSYCPDGSISRIASRLRARAVRNFVVDSINKVTDVNGAIDEEGNPSQSQLALLNCIFSWEGEFTPRFVNSIVEGLESNECKRLAHCTRLVSAVMKNESARVALLALPEQVIRLAIALGKKKEDAEAILDGIVPEEATKEEGEEEETKSKTKSTAKGSKMKSSSSSADKKADRSKEEATTNMSNAIIECLATHVKLLMHYDFSHLGSGSSWAMDAVMGMTVWLQTRVVPELQAKSRTDEIYQKIVASPVDATHGFSLRLSSSLLLVINDYIALSTAILTSEPFKEDEKTKISALDVNAMQSLHIMSKTLFKLNQDLLRVRSTREALNLAAAVGWKLLSREIVNSASHPSVMTPEERLSFVSLLVLRDSTVSRRLSTSALRDMCKLRKDYVHISLELLWRSISAQRENDDYTYEVDLESGSLKGDAVIMEAILNVFVGSKEKIESLARWLTGKLEKRRYEHDAIWNAVQMCSLAIRPPNKRIIAANALNPIRSLLMGLFAQMRESHEVEATLRSRIDQLIKDPAMSKR